MMPHSNAKSSASKADRNIPNLQPALHIKISAPDVKKVSMAQSKELGRFWVAARDLHETVYKPKDVTGVISMDEWVVLQI